MSEEKVPYETPGEKKDTSPIFGQSQRHKRKILIEERNEPPMPNTFDTMARYPSDELPEWFAPLQPIVEDASFTSMVILFENRQTKSITRYYLSIAEYSEVERYNQEREERNRIAREGIDKPWLPVYDGE
jgi:hypothetical protein